MGCVGEDMSIRDVLDGAAFAGGDCPRWSAEAGETFNPVFWVSIGARVDGPASAELAFKAPVESGVRYWLVSLACGLSLSAGDKKGLRETPDDPVGWGVTAGDLLGSRNGLVECG